MPNLTGTHPDDREHIARGALVALAGLPIALGLGLLPLPLERIWLGVICLALPFIVRFAYTRGSGGYLVSGKVVVGVITVASILLAAVTITLVITHGYYLEFGGVGSVFSTGYLVFFRSGILGSPEMFFSLIAALVTGVPAMILALVTARKPPIRKISETVGA